MSKPFCPECGQPATGNFCQSCGAKLGGRFCNQCGHKLSAGAHFCNQCGNAAPGGKARGGARGGEHRAAAAAAFGGHNVAWWIAGAAMFVLIVFVGTSMVRSEGPSVPPAATGGAAPATGAGGAVRAPDISQMSPIERADALYDRIMRAVSDGDSLEAQQFMPMALGAYELAEPLSHDGLFHLSLLQRVGQSHEEALATAERILEDDPNHLLGLVAAAEAAQELGRSEDAAGYYGRIVAAYDDEMVDPRPEYLDHFQGIVENLKTQAEAFLAGR